MEPHRTERVSEALREELTEIIEYELSDPRLAAVRVTGVLVAPDLRKAHVLFLAEGAPEQGRQAREALEHAANYLRGELSRRLSMWRVPESRSCWRGCARIEKKNRKTLKNSPNDATVRATFVFVGVGGPVGPRPSGSGSSVRLPRAVAARAEQRRHGYQLQRGAVRL